MQKYIEMKKDEELSSNRSKYGSKLDIDTLTKEGDEVALPTESESQEKEENNSASNGGNQVKEKTLKVPVAAKDILTNESLQSHFRSLSQK